MEDLDDIITKESRYYIDFNSFFLDTQEDRFNSMKKRLFNKHFKKVGLKEYIAENNVYDATEEVKEKYSHVEPSRIKYLLFSDEFKSKRVMAVRVVNLGTYDSVYSMDELIIYDGKLYMQVRHRLLYDNTESKASIYYSDLSRKDTDSNSYLDMSFASKEYAISYVEKVYEQYKEEVFAEIEKIKADYKSIAKECKKQLSSLALQMEENEDEVKTDWGRMLKRLTSDFLSKEKIQTI
jgi:hypothetical protein